METVSGRVRESVQKAGKFIQLAIDDSHEAVKIQGGCFLCLFR